MHHIASIAGLGARHAELSSCKSFNLKERRPQISLKIAPGDVRLMHHVAASWYNFTTYKVVHAV